MSKWWNKKWLGSGDVHDEEEDYDYEDSPRVRRRAPSRFTPRESRSISYRNIYESDAEQDEYEKELREQKEEDWDDKADKIRAGKYKPKRTDPWTLHVLYQNLKETKKI